jgi:hypothetical protein
LSKSSITAGENITITVIAQSNSPCNWINRSLTGPNGNIYGGGSGVSYTEISSGIWKYEWTENLSTYSPIGIYTYSGVSVKNQANLQSGTWQNLNFTIGKSFNDWISQFNSSLNKPGDIISGDGISNIVKYSLGLNPTQFQSLPSISTDHPGYPDYFSYIVPLNTDSVNVGVDILMSNNLISWVHANTDGVNIIQNKYRDRIETFVKKTASPVFLKVLITY